MTNTETDLITAAEATSALGFKNRSSLTRLVQRGDITPKFVASGKTGEQFFDKSDVERLKADRTARMNGSEVVGTGATDRP